MRVFLGGSKNSAVALSVMCWECIYSMIVHVSLTIDCTCSVVGEWPVCIAILWVCVDFSKVVSCVHYANASTFITWFDDNGLVILKVIQCWFFL